MADDNQKSRNILENSNFLKHRCCLEDRAFLSNSIELVQRENFLALVIRVLGFQSAGDKGNKVFSGTGYSQEIISDRA